MGARTWAGISGLKEDEEMRRRIKRMGRGWKMMIRRKSKKSAREGWGGRRGEVEYYYIVGGGLEGGWGGRGGEGGYGAIVGNLGTVVELGGLSPIMNPDFPPQCWDS
jgi:hypothetical protein